MCQYDIILVVASLNVLKHVIGGVMLKPYHFPSVFYQAYNSCSGKSLGRNFINSRFIQASLVNFPDQHESYQPYNITNLDTTVSMMRHHHYQRFIESDHKQKLRISPKECPPMRRQAFSSVLDYTSPINPI